MPSQIDWENRKVDDIGNDCLVGVDGVDCLYKTRQLYDGSPDSRFYSYKFKKSGLRYEIALGLRNDNICNISGPFRPGSGGSNDLTIFRLGVKAMLEPGERVEADDGYRAEAPRFCKTPNHWLTRKDQERMRGRLRRRHETINRRIKVFKALDVVFRHNVEKHSICFRVACIMVQLAIECGEQALFDVREYDDRLSDDQAEAAYL